LIEKLLVEESLDERERKGWPMILTSKALSQNEPMVARLRQHPLLRGLNHDQLVLLADCALTAEFGPGDVVFRQGDPARLFYLIESGKVILESGNDYGAPVIIETIGAGDLLGWSWMMPPYRWHFTARAIKPTRAIYFAGTILRYYCDRGQSLGFELHKVMSQIIMKRLQAARKKMLGVHAHAEMLPPVPRLSPFMEQELDDPEFVREPPAAAGALH
jgi:CRP/FNR family transcriptional regulator, cyclic AMP receptor protein